MIIRVMNFLGLLSLMLSKPKGLSYMLKYSSDVGQGFSLADKTKISVGQGFSLANKGAIYA